MGKPENSKPPNPALNHLLQALGSFGHCQALASLKVVGSRSIKFLYLEARGLTKSVISRL